MDIFMENLAEILERDKQDISAEDRFREYEEWDSLTALGVLAMINQNYDVTIPRIEFDKLFTVSDLYNKVVELMG